MQISRTEPIRTSAILGPTAAGKTSVALEIAELLGAEIISCDSRQIYQGMNIGTAKPTASELFRVRHWLIDFLDPAEQYSAYSFARDACAIIRKRSQNGVRQLICGGTGLYYAALTQGLVPHGESDPDVRREYEEMALRLGNRAVYEELSRVDPASAMRVHPNDLYRTIRALQVYRQTGKPMSAVRESSAGPSDIRFKTILLMMDRSALYQRIDKRVDAMVRAGLWDEFVALRKAGYDADAPGLRCVGYKELFAVQQGAMSFGDAVEQIKRNTRRYAKRQFTWFARQTAGTHIDTGSVDGRSKAARLVKQFFAET